MTNTIRIKRSTGSNAPTTLANAELAYAEGSGVGYIGVGTGGAGGSATSVVAAFGSGAFVSLSGTQTVSGSKTFSGSVALGGSATATTPSASDNSTKVATTAYVQTELSNFGTGTVTSVALSLPSIFSVSGSPITSSGTLTGTLASQTAATVFAAPTGATGTPTFRALVAADLPDLSSTYLPTSGGTISSNLTITGDLTVNGTTTTVNSTTVDVADKNITLGNVATPSDATADGGGISLLGASTKTFNWVDATDAWTSSEHIDLASGKAFYINGTQVLSGSSLGSGVTASSLTSVGTISTGVWQGTTIGVAYGGTGATTLTGLVKGNGTSAFTAAVAGTDYLSPSSEIDGGSY